MEIIEYEIVKCDKIKSKNILRNGDCLIHLESVSYAMIYHWFKI